MIRKILKSLILITVLISFSGCCSKLKTQEDYFVAFSEKVSSVNSHVEEIDEQMDNNLTVYSSFSTIKPLSLSSIIDNAEEIINKTNELITLFAEVYEVKINIELLGTQIELQVSNINKNNTSLSKEDFEYLKTQYEIVSNAEEIIGKNKQVIIDRFYVIANSSLNELTLETLIQIYNQLITIVNEIKIEINKVNTSLSGLRIMLGLYVV